MRVADWPERMIDVIRGHELMSFSLGRSDCWCLAMDVVRAVTGSDPYAKARRYSTAVGSRRVLRTEGFTSIEQALAAAFEAVPPALAQRGDLGVIETPEGQAACVCEGVLWVGKGPAGVTRFSRDRVIAAFKVV
ncbi:MAG: hypothetical protein AB7E55_25315 [Pigmentiphaga sp.]